MKILFFAPHSELWVHAFPEALVAEALAQTGHEVTYVSCGRSLKSHCVPMGAYGLSPGDGADARERICARCQRNEAVLRRQLALSGASLADFTEADDENSVSRLLNIENGPALLDVERNGVPLGRIALYELMLRKKLMDLELGEQHWQDYRVGLANVIRVALAGERMLDRERPQALVVYNSLYSANAVICRQARQLGINQYFLHAGTNLSNRLQTLIMGQRDGIASYYHVARVWQGLKHVPASPRSLRLVTEHFLQLIVGRNIFAYSKAGGRSQASIRAHFGVPTTSRLLVAAVSSNDETIAAEVVGAMPAYEPPVFSTQIKWLEHLVEFLERRPDLFLIVRVHPREFPNRRERQVSQHAKQLQAALEKLPRNVAVNWPDDDISLYDLPDETDVFLTAWSSVGREMPMLGVPVVTFAPGLLFYGEDLNYTASTVEEYFAAIDQALVDGWSFERARIAYRWGVMEFVHSLLDISDSYTQIENEDYTKRPFARRVVDGIGRRLVPDYQQLRDCLRRSNRLAVADTINEIVTRGAKSVVDLLDPATIEQGTLQEETAALRVELARLAEALFPTAEARAASRLYPKLTGAWQKG